MRWKLNVKLILIVCVTFICYSFYLSTYIDTNDYDSAIKDMQFKMDIMEKEFDENNKLIKSLRMKVKDLIDRTVPSPLSQSPSVSKENHVPGPHIAKEDANGRCYLQSSADVLMSKVLDEIPFANIDGGAWKQGFDISYPENQFTSTNKLEVFLVPHTHCDPGWLKTFEQYFTTQKGVKNILDNVLMKLESDTSYKFIYAELSFFSKWFEGLDETKKVEMLKYVTEKRFELVSGGWVMPDEAASHYIAMIDQLIEGHSWMRRHLGIMPESGWSIDPFGASPTMAQLLHLAGVKSMLIQRTHYEVKKKFAQEKMLEFFWRQQWEQDNSNDILAHMMPFYSYDVPHTCGPDPSVCCQFDFARLKGNKDKYNCPWKKAPVEITDDNVDERAKLLLEQYRKKAALYKTNAVLIPLGDDFRYSTPWEFDKQMLNYKRLFNHMNGKTDWHVNARFATLTEYFSHVQSKLSSKALSLPVFSGDFFPYADRENHYWTGYYTSRPFSKRLSRQAESMLRMAEGALANARTRGLPAVLATRLLSNLVEGRRNVDLFQHHDGITGTARAAVVTDYTNRLFKALSNFDEVTRFCLSYLTSGKTELIFMPYLEYKDIIQPAPIDLYATGEKATLVSVYNSVARSREFLVCIVTIQPYAIVTDWKNNVRHSETYPIFNNKIDKVAATELTIHDGKFKICWQASLGSMETALFKVHSVSSLSGTPSHSMASIVVPNQPEIADALKGRPGFVFKIEYLPNSVKDIELKAGGTTAVVSRSGLLEMIRYKTANGGTAQMDISTSFVTYATQDKKDKSGAYLFLPDKDAVPLAIPQNPKPVVAIVKGKFRAMSVVGLPFLIHVISVKDISNPDDAIPSENGVVGISNLVHINFQEKKNFELFMRVETGLKLSKHTFYTDLNGLSYQKRTYRDKMTLQGNVYPMTTMAWMEDVISRVSVVSAQSCAVTSRRKGTLDFGLDRRLGQDDGRGLGEPVLDNKITLNKFAIVLEMAESQAQAELDDKIAPAPTALAVRALESLIMPQVAWPTKSAVQSQDLREGPGLFDSLPCDYELVMTKTLQKHEDQAHGDPVADAVDAGFGAVLRRYGFDCRYRLPPTCSLSSSPMKIGSLLRDPGPGTTKVSQSTLTFGGDHEGWAISDVAKTIEVAPHNLAAFYIYPPRIHSTT